MKHGSFIPRGVGCVSSVKLMLKIKIAHGRSAAERAASLLHHAFLAAFCDAAVPTRMDKRRADQASSGIRVPTAMHPCTLRRPADRNVTDNQRMLLDQAMGGMSDALRPLHPCPSALSPVSQFSHASNSIISYANSCRLSGLRGLKDPPKNGSNPSRHRHRQSTPKGYAPDGIPHRRTSGHSRQVTQ